MEVGLSSANFYPDINTEDTIDIISKLGFQNVEIFLNTTCEYEEKFINKLNEKKINNKLKVVSVHSFSSSFEPFLFDRYKRRRDDNMKLFKSVCKAGALLGAKYYTFHGIRLINGVTFNMEHIINVYDELLYTALECGIQLTQENVSWCLSSDIQFLSELIEKCKYPMGFTLDIKQAFKTRRVPKDYIDVIGKYLKNIHINDRNETSVCLLPGRGNVNYDEFFKELKLIGYNGDLIIEVYKENYRSLSELTDSKVFIEKYIY